MATGELTSAPAGTLPRRPFQLAGQGILAANVALVLVAVLVLRIDVFSRGSLSTLTPVIGVMMFVALGQAFIIGTGGIDLSVPATITLVGTVVLKASGGRDGRMVPAILLALAACLVIGLVNGVLVELTRLAALVVTLATGQLIAGVTRMYRGPVLAVSNVPGDLSRFARASVLRISIILIVAVAVSVAVGLWLKYHTSGRTLAASSVARLAAENTGLAATRQRIVAWVAGTLLVGVGGILLAGQISTPDLTLGTPYLLTPIVAVVLGGAAITGGRVRTAATALGAVFLMLLEHIFRVRGFSSGVALAVEGIVLGAGLTIAITTRRLSRARPRALRPRASAAGGTRTGGDTPRQQNQE
jgi:ribose transport system permease protein